MEKNKIVRIPNYVDARTEKVIDIIIVLLFDSKNLEVLKKKLLLKNKKSGNLLSDMITF